jgi:hypothetical protein
MDKLTEELLEMKTIIDDKKAKKSRLEGKLQTLQEQMEKDFACVSIEDGKIKLETIENEKAEKEKIIRIGIEKLRDEYEF